MRLHHNKYIYEFYFYLFHCIKINVCCVHTLTYVHCVHFMRVLCTCQNFNKSAQNGNYSISKRRGTAKKKKNNKIKTAEKAKRKKNI